LFTYLEPNNYLQKKERFQDSNIKVGELVRPAILFIPTLYPSLKAVAIYCLSYAQALIPATEEAFQSKS